jgi:hypothetical protein
MARNKYLSTARVQRMKERQRSGQKVAQVVYNDIQMRGFLLSAGMLDDPHASDAEVRVKFQRLIEGIQESKR